MAQIMFKKAFDAKAANGASISIPVQGFRHLAVTVIASATAALTLKTYAADSQDPIGAVPDFSAAASSTNPIATIELIDLEDEAKLVGDTGLVFATPGAVSVRRYAVNGDNCDYLGFVVSGYSAGTVTVLVRGVAY